MAHCITTRRRWTGLLLVLQIPASWKKVIHSRELEAKQTPYLKRALITVLELEGSLTELRRFVLLPSILPLGVPKIGSRIERSLNE